LAEAGSLASASGHISRQTNDSEEKEGEINVVDDRMLITPKTKNTPTVTQSLQLSNYHFH
jgi:hypothetical protein